MDKKVPADRSESKPSEVTDAYWIWAKNNLGTYPATTSKGGKWLIFARVEDVDEIWSKIKKATEEGKLGQESKVATAKPSPRTIDLSKRVICVFTYDWTDAEDVRRVRAELRSLGITGKISYKANEDTSSNKYRATGHTRISKYFE